VAVAWAFLVAAAIVTFFTLSAFFPLKRFWLLLLPSFVSSLVTGELAAHHLFWQAIGTAAFVSLGALDAWPGWVGLGLAFVSGAGLVVALLEARRAGPAVDAALVEALGPDPRAAIVPELAGQLDEPFSLRQRLLPIPVYDRRVERLANLAFATRGGKSMGIDVYRRRDRPRGRPALLFVHGGAWVVGRKDDQGLPLLYRLAAHGWVCFSAGYRKSPAATFPDHIVDVKAALRWIREHGADYGADPRFIAIAGGSAGGHLAALAALTPDEPSWKPEPAGDEVRVAACVPFYGVYDFTDRRGRWRHSPLLPILERAVIKRRRDAAFEIFDAASPMSRVRADAPPFFVVHGTRDVLVPVDDARHFVQLLRARSRAPVAYAELPGAQHAFDLFPSERTLHVLRGVETFLAWVYSERLRREYAGAEMRGHAS
jgi:acetyl esterase/lipase